MTAPLIIPEGIAAAEEPFEPKSAPCPSCSTSMTVTAGGVQGLADHLERCQTASAEERAFYRQHRRWPKTPEQKKADNDRARERYHERQMRKGREGPYPVETKPKPEAKHVPLPCPGGCGLDLALGTHKPESKCSHAPRWRKFFEEES